MWYGSCELTSNSSSQSQHKLVLLGGVVLRLSFHILIQRPDKALQGLSSYWQERLQLPLHHTHTHTIKLEYNHISVHPGPSIQSHSDLLKHPFFCEPTYLSTCPSNVYLPVCLPTVLHISFSALNYFICFSVQHLLPSITSCAQMISIFYMTLWEFTIKPECHLDCLRNTHTHRLVEMTHISQPLWDCVLPGRATP